MTNKAWFKEPELKTTGIVKRFTKEIKFVKELEGQSLSDFLQEWKRCSAAEASTLYYGEVYKVKELSLNHLILQIRRRRGNAYHYIECKYDQDSCKIIMKIQSPNSTGYFYALWPLMLLIFLFLLLDNSQLGFSFFQNGLFFIFAGIAILTGIFFLDLSIRSAQVDLERAMFKLKGLSPDE